MHSFHQSRGKILFELLCLLVLAASLAGAWLQTGASALLPAAAATALLGFAQLLPRRSRHSAALDAPPDVACASEEQGELLAGLDADSTSPEPAGEVAPAEPAEEAHQRELAPAAELYQAPIEQLFDHEPFLRNQRAVFGRKTEKVAASSGRRPRKKSSA